jgi:hypothetical protein
MHGKPTAKIGFILFPKLAQHDQNRPLLSLSQGTGRLLQYHHARKAVHITSPNDAQCAAVLPTMHRCSYWPLALLQCAVPNCACCVNIGLHALHALSSGWQLPSAESIAQAAHICSALTHLYHLYHLHK